MEISILEENEPTRKLISESTIDASEAYTYKSSVQAVLES